MTQDFSNSWQYAAPRALEHPIDVVEASIKREFNLPWPYGKSVGKGEMMVEAYRVALTK